MTDLYLIAHKVRGEPAFDVAHRMDCPSCNGHGGDFDGDPACHECDTLGYWWIIPTSGHRAYPYWDAHIESLLEDAGVDDEVVLSTMPEGLPDHYLVKEAPKVSLIEALGLAKPKASPPAAPIARRF